MENEQYKKNLIQMCALVSTCIRDYNSIYRQYRECIYGEIDLYKPKEDRLNWFYRYHDYGLKMLSQRVIMVETSVYIYMYKECLVIVLGNYTCEHTEGMYNKIIKYIKDYKIITSNTCPTVVWCCVNVYIEKFMNTMHHCIHNVAANNIYHDVFILGTLDKRVLHTIDANCNLRKKTFIALSEEKVNKKRYIILDGYGFNVKESNIFDYLLTIMNRVTGI